MSPLVALPVQAADVLLEKIVLDGKRLDLRIEQAITAADIERTMDAASTFTLTVHDPDRVLEGSGILAARIDVEVNGMSFRLVQITKQGDEYRLTFEDKIVALMRTYTKPRKANRSTVTRAEFAKMLVDEVTEMSIGFYSPELHVVQPIGTSKNKQTQAAKDATRQPGFGPDANVTVKGVKATAEQRGNIARVLDVGLSLNVPRKVLVAAIATIITESTALNLAGGMGGSVGLFQQTKPGWPASRDVEVDATAFFKACIALNAQQPNLSVNDLAQGVQRSGVPNGYAPWVEEADRAVGEYGSTAGQVAKKVTLNKNYEFSRGQPGGKPENTWDCLGRLAQEVNWRRFVVGSTVYFVSDDDLMQSRPIMSLRESDAGVDWIDYDIDTGKTQWSATVTCRALRWVAPPGSVVVLEQSGPASGRWLVGDIRRSLMDPNTSITLRKAQAPLPEPAASTQTLTTSLAGNTAAARVVTAAQKALKNAGKYVYRQVRPMAGSLFSSDAYNKTDCSAFATLCYKAAGAPDPNGNDYNGNGSTVTLQQNGTVTTSPQPGDLAFYSSPAHVGVYIGGGKIIEFGSTPIREADVHYRSDFIGFRTYGIG